MCETAVPVRSGETLIGFLQTGQIFCKRPTGAQFRRVSRQLRAWGLNVNGAELRKRILAAIRKVLAGEIAVSEKMSAKILQIFSGRRDDAPHSPIERLSDREFEVFQLIGSGKSTRQMAEELHLSAKTVEVHRAHIKEKLQIKTAPELISYAARWGEGRSAARE